MADRSLRASSRRWSDVLHRWLGFTAGAALVIIGLTGSLLAFYMEVERGWYPHMQSATPHALPATYEAIYQRLAQLPVDPPGGTWRIEIPPDGGVITSRYAAPGARTRMVTLDPLTLEVKRDAFWNRTFFTFVYDIHEYLQLGSGARPWIGYVCLLMVVVLLTGATSWLLPRGRTAAKFSFRWRHTTSARRTYDLHKLGGAYTLVFLSVVVGTGALISMPTHFRPVLNAFSTLAPAEPDVHSQRGADTTRIPVDRILAMAQTRFPGSTVVWVRVPTNARQTYDLQIRQAGAPMNRFPRTHMYIDQYSGDVLAIKDPRTDGWGDRVLNWLVPIHDGKAFGTVGRVIVFILGLVPAVLFITGFLRWNQKRRVTRRARSAIVHRLRRVAMNKHVAALFIVVAIATPLLAHHTIAGAYNPDRQVKVVGTLNRVEWKQPHVVIHVDVKEQSGNVMWTIESQTPLVLQSHGLRADMLQPGMAISSTVCVARDGSHRGYAQAIFLPTGSTILSFGCGSSRSTP